ncbi:Exopolyphosphatase-related protein [Olavius algarvensis Delta 1 endosymbiont]|nr:Exopolyphosphatase-related protein [Olavius algarvensis Delta 1 endosymbiont]
MRIVTRPDFDGIVCAVLLRDALNIEWTHKRKNSHYISMIR